MKLVDLDKLKYLRMFMSKSINRQNYMIYKSEVENILYYIIKNNPDFFYKSKGNIYDLTEEFEIFIKLGLIRRTSNFDLFYIIKEKPIDTNNEVGEIIDKMLDINKLCETYSDLEVVIDNPNGIYNLINGSIENKTVKTKIYTDGSVSDNYLQLVKGKSNIGKINNEIVLFDQVKKNIVHVSDSSYVLKQELINDCVTLNNLFIQTTNLERIDGIAKKYCKKR